MRPNELSFLDADAWKDIYVPHGGSARLGDMARYDRFYQWAGPNAPETLVSLDRSYHDSMKRQLAPAFSERALQFQEPIIQGYTDILMRRLTEHSKDGQQPVNLREWFNYYTFDIIGNLGFGSDFGGLESQKDHPWVKAVSRNIREFSFMQVLMYLGLQQIVHTLANSSILRGKVLHENLTREKVEARMHQEKPRPDFFQPLLDRKPPLTVDQLLENASQLIMAGSESSVTLLVAALSLLTDNPATMEELTQEIRSSFKNEDEITLTSVNRLTYLRACLNEALRLFPAVPPALPRVVPRGGAVITGHTVPENTVVYVASWAANHSERHFAKPSEFHPERFLKDPEFAGDRFDAFQPFGLGHGNCPGRNLAWAETRLAMARLIYNFDIESLPESRNWTSKQKAYMLWDKKPFWAVLKPVR
ncbi:Averantin oxidoreductase [Fusarium beomiforme]|uniref:Averantin oxidoreductase n=1 Tax=Fusarium beomiforme TaxID=44412 RepID=A0A9P5DVA8_9HYPO|nr:Averantin oxidoreductase [Fusarium beomiforme]